MVLYEYDIKRIAQVHDYIHGHLGEDLDRNILALKFGLSSSTLDRHFYYCYKITLPQYIRKCRMETAMDMITGRKLAISEVAISTGFKNISSFSHAFTKYFGKPPTTVLKDGN